MTFRNPLFHPIQGKLFSKSLVSIKFDSIPYYFKGGF